MVNRVREVVPTLASIGVPIGVFNFDITARPLFTFTVELDPINPVPVFDGSKEDLKSPDFPFVGWPSYPTSGGGSFDDGKKEDTGPEERPESPEAYVEQRTIVDYPYTGPKCELKAHEIGPIRKANCHREYRLRVMNAFDSSHIFYSDGYEFHGTHLDVLAKSGTNLYYSVQAAAAAMFSVSSTGFDACFCFEERATLCTKYVGAFYEDEDENNTGGDDNPTHTSDLYVGGINTLGGAVKATYVAGRPTPTGSDKVDMAFIVGQAGNYIIRKVIVNDQVVFDASAVGDQPRVHPTLGDAGTVIRLWNGGNTQSVPPIFLDLHGQKSPAYRDLTILVIESFPKAFFTEARLKVQVEVASFIELPQVDVDTGITSSHMHIDKEGNAIYVDSNTTNGISIYNQSSFLHDRNVAQDLTSIISYRSTYNGNLMVYAQPGGDHTIRAYHDYLFDEFDEYILDGIPSVYTAAYINNGNQMCAVVGQTVHLIWKGLAERTFTIRGDAHTIITRDTFHYIFTTKRIYKLDGESRYIVGGWEIGSNHAIRDDGGRGFILFDEQTHDVTSVRLLDGEGYRINWEGTNPFRLTGKLQTSTSNNGGQYTFISGDKLVQLNMFNGLLKVLGTTTIDRRSSTPQFYDSVQQRVTYISTLGKIVTSTPALIDSGSGTTLLNILQTVIGEDNVTYDIEEIEGLYGYIHTGKTADYINLLSFFNLRMAPLGDTVLVTNKPPDGQTITFDDAHSIKYDQSSTNYLAQVGLKYFDMTNNGASIISYADDVSNDLVSMEGVSRTYSLPLYADARVGQRLAESILYTQQAVQDTTTLEVGPRNFLITPGDYIDGVGYVTDTTTNKYEQHVKTTGFIQDTIGFDKMFDDITPGLHPEIVSGTPIPSITGASSAHVIQSHARTAPEGLEGSVVYLAAIPLLTKQTQLNPEKFVSEQVSTTAFPTEALKYGSLVSIDKGIQGDSCVSRPFTTDYDGQVEVLFTPDIPENFFTSQTYDALLADEKLNLLLIGDELIQFMNVTYLTPDRKHVRFHGGLFRGRRGTDLYYNTHEVGERVYYMGNDAIVPASVQASKLIFGRGIVVGVGQVVSSRVISSNSRVTVTEFLGRGDAPWAIANAWLSTDESPDGDYVFWLNRYRHELPFIDDFTKLQQPSAEYIRQNGFTDTGAGFARGVNSTLYALREPFDKDRFEIAVREETFSVSDYIIGPVPSISNYIIRGSLLQQDDSVLLYTSGMQEVDLIGILGGPGAGVYFVVVNKYLNQRDKSYSPFYFPLYKAHEDTVIDARCSEVV